MSTLDSDALVYWVHTTLSPLYERSLRAATWCPRWWEHAEALFRLHLVHQSWQVAVASQRDNPQALSDWLLHTADPHLAVLISPSGPFAECAWNERRGFAQPHQPKGLPHEWPDDFDDARFPAARPDRAC